MLNLTPKIEKQSLKLNLKLKDFSSEIRETPDGTRIAKGIDWELWIIPLNFVLKVGTKDYYFSSFTQLLRKLSEHRIKYWLTEEKWYRVEYALESVDREIKEIGDKISANLDIISEQYSIIRTE